jgi:hypothetical protein
MGEEKGASGWSFADKPRRVRLVGKTKHGKDRVRQHGDICNVTEASLQLDSNRMMLESLHETFTVRMPDGEVRRFKDGRSIDKTNDKDFDWEFI